MLEDVPETVGTVTDILLGLGGLLLKDNLRAA
jgi:hypothetical protein